MFNWILFFSSLISQFLKRVSKVIVLFQWLFNLMCSICLANSNFRTVVSCVLLTEGIFMTCFSIETICFTAFEYSYNAGAFSNLNPYITWPLHLIFIKEPVSIFSSMTKLSESLRGSPFSFACSVQSILTGVTNSFLMLFVTAPNACGLLFDLPVITSKTCLFPCIGWPDAKILMILSYTARSKGVRFSDKEAFSSPFLIEISECIMNIFFS